MYFLFTRKLSYNRGAYKWGGRLIIRCIFFVYSRQAYNWGTYKWRGGKGAYYRIYFLFAGRCGEGGGAFKL